MSEAYVPDVGHVIWIGLDPQRGRGQAGHRPFLTLSPAEYNRRTSLVVGCPMTSKMKGYPFEVALPTEGDDAPSVVLVDQIKSLDWRARGASFKSVVPAGTLARVRDLLSTFLSLR